MVVYRYPFRSKFVFGTKYGVKGDSWSCGYHCGIDLKSKNYGGDGIVYPIAPGVVESINLHGSSYGRHLCVKHDDGMVSLYAHLEYITATKGQRVTQTTKLGREGTTGNSSGVHLHLELHKNKYQYPAKIDPMQWIENHLEEVEDLQIKKLTVYINNKPIEIDTVYQDGTNYLKLRDLAEALGAQVKYNAETQRIDIIKKV